MRTGSSITEIPEITDPSIEVLDLYPVVKDYAYIRITYNNNRSEYLYEVIEPELSREERDLLDLIKDTLHRTLGYEWERLTQLDKEEYLRESVDSYIRTRGVKVEQLTKKRIGYYIIRDFVGHGLFRNDLDAIALCARRVADDEDLVGKVARHDTLKAAWVKGRNGEPVRA